MPRSLNRLTTLLQRMTFRLGANLPQGIKTILARNTYLTRLFIYLSSIQTSSHSPPGTRKFTHAYLYRQPVFTPEIKKRLDNFKYKPLISIVIPVFNGSGRWLESAILSIENQWYKHWELCIADDGSHKLETLDYLKSIKSPNIKIIYLPKNEGIAAASNQALTQASGEYVALMDQDDELTVDALYEVVNEINQTTPDFIYTDEDKINAGGTYSEPHFKPDFSPELFLSQNYLSHLGVVKKSILDEIHGFNSSMNGAQDYDLYLRILEQTIRIAHIPRVLYHWRRTPDSSSSNFHNKSYAQTAGKLALTAAIKRRNLDASVVNGKYPGTYRVRYAIKNTPLVSIIIPFRDEPELLKKCIHSILEKTTYQNFEIICVNNNSSEAATFPVLEKLESLDRRISFFEYNVPFNYSQINNYAVENFSSGDIILLLNNDIEIISPGWIESMLEFAQRKDVGVVGAKLFYPDNHIQHAGIIIGVGGVAGHSHKYFDKVHHGYFSRPHLLQNLSAVTGACFMVKRSIYTEVGGLDEVNLKIAFNDVDFCLRIREKHYLNVYTPFAEAYHHESYSRGHEITTQQQARFQEEVEYMLQRHTGILESGDPYYNPQLSLENESFEIA